MMFFLSLMLKMSIFVSLLVACLLSLMTFFSLAFVESQLKAAIYTQQAALTSAMAKELDYKMSLYRNELVDVARSISPGMLADRDRAARFLGGGLHTRAMFNGGLFLFSPDGRVLAGTMPEPTGREKTASVKEVVASARTGVPRISDPFLGSNEQGHPIVMFSAPVPGTSGEVAAVLVGQVNLIKENVFGEVARARIGESGYFYILSQGRILITHPDKGRVFTSVPPGVNGGLDRAIEGIEETGENTNSKGVRLLSTFRLLDSTNWIISANYPLEEAYASIGPVKRMMAIGLIAMVIASILVVWLAMRHFMTPLLSFTRQVKTISGKEALSRPVQINSRDEIEELATAFNTLMHDIAHHKGELREQKDFEASLIQHSSLPTFVVDADHRLLHWNKACEALTGIPAGEILGTRDQWRGFYGDQRPTLADLVIDRAWQQLASFYSRFEKRGDGFHAEGWYADLNGEDRYLSFYAGPIFNRKGEIVAAIETVKDISARKRSEEALRTLSCAVEQSPNAVVITDTQGTREYVNPKFSALTGFPPEDVIGKHWRTLRSDEMPTEYFAAMWDTVSSGLEWSGEFCNKKKNGELYWESASISPVKDEAGVITHYVAFASDITGQKLAGERIGQTLSLLNATLESTADGIFVCDLSGRVLTYNRKFAQMWRLPETLLDAGDEEPMRLFVLDQLKEPGRFLETTGRHYTRPELESDDILELKDGRVFERVSRPQIVEHEIVGRVVSIRDITERERTLEALRESAERYRSLVDNIDLGITLIDSNYRIVMSNSTAGKMFGKSAAGLADKKCYREFEKSPGVCRHCPGRTAMRTGEPATVQTEGLRDDGSSMIAKVKAFPVFGPNGQVTGFIEVIQDITLQVKAGNDKRLIEEQLRQSQKFEAIGTLAGGIAHDFNNFLTVITSYCTIMERRTAEDDPLRQYLGKMVCATEKATMLTKGLLAFSRKQALDPWPVDLRVIIQKLDSLLERLLGEDIDLTIQLTDESLTILADSLQIDQVLMNLAANARDAMSGGGVLQIAAGRFDLDTEFVRAHGYGIPGSYALLTVSDTGVGMDAETKKRVFEPFFTTKGVGKGSGLGLSMAYGIIKQHNGFINIYSEEGKGTTFRIYLPLTELAKTEIGYAEPSRQVGGDETILLVEDDPEIRKSLNELLEGNGYTVIAAVDGEDGIRKFHEHAEEIQLLLLDVIIPKKNGWEVCEAIKALSPGIKAIFMSGYTADILSAKGVLRGDVNLISKPISINSLSAKIREVLDK